MKRKGIKDKLEEIERIVKFQKKRIYDKEAFHKAITLRQALNIIQIRLSEIEELI